MVKQFRDRHQLSGFVVVADAGMLSGQNLEELDDADIRFIVGAKTSKAPMDLESHVRWHGDEFDDGQIIDTVTVRGKNTRQQRAVINDLKSSLEPCWDDKDTNLWRAVWQYRSKRAARDVRTLTKQQEKAEAVVAGDKSSKSVPYRSGLCVSREKSGVSFNQSVFDQAMRLVGLKGDVTNVPSSQVDAAELIGFYHRLWHVERSFRMAKHDLAARPVFHRTRDSIEAHLTVASWILWCSVGGGV